MVGFLVLVETKGLEEFLEGKGENLGKGRDEISVGGICRGAMASLDIESGV